MPGAVRGGSAPAELGEVLGAVQRPAVVDEAQTLGQPGLLGRSGQSWRTFLRNHNPELWACDLLQLRDVLFRPIFAFFFVVHGDA
jgi:hypothetical protein